METIRTKNMSYHDWLIERRKGIGGSDVATVLGLNKYKTPFELWLDKTGQIDIEETEPSEAAYWGNQFEEVVAKEFERRTDKKVRRKNSMFFHNQYPFLTANIDRTVLKEPAFLECKTASAYLSKEWEGDEIPAQYMCQIQHYMNVLDEDYCYIAVLIGGQKFIWKKIERDQELIEMIQQKLINFWEQNVMKKIAPEIDGSQSANDFINKMYQTNITTDVLSLGHEADEIIAHLDELKHDMKPLIELENQYKNQLKNALGKHEYGVTPDGHKAIWKSIYTERFDAKELKKRSPETYKAYLKTTESRRLSYK